MIGLEHILTIAAFLFMTGGLVGLCFDLAKAMALKDVKPGRGV